MKRRRDPMDKSRKHQVYNLIKHLYPLSGNTNQLPSLLAQLIDVIDHKVKNEYDARIGRLSSPEMSDKLTLKYSTLPDQPNDSTVVSSEIVDDLFDGVLRWRSPNLQHNVGSPVSTTASALYALALDENIYSIDDGLAGNALIAEKAVTNILSDLAKLESPGAGFFVFGGTATNLYASKVGLQKAFPETSILGTPRNIKLFVTEEAHFTHRLSADWLGIGTNNVIEITANHDRSSNIAAAEQALRQAIEAGDIISGIMLNGGSTYSHVVDDIEDFVNLRDRLVQEYELTYRPHIHVDSVIGWSWLFFGTYDFVNNPLGITPKALGSIERQYELIASLKRADSWGVDFHKGIGGCPVDCSVIMFNNPQDVFAISKSVDPKLATHQLATELTRYAPSDFTLETSRSGGTGLAALATLRALGREGYQRNLANLVESTCTLREAVEKESDMRVINDYSLGFSTMIRIYPPEMRGTSAIERDLTSNKQPAEEITVINAYIKEFYTWDFNNRIARNDGPSPSFSSGFFNYHGTKVSALKYYPTSPHYSPEHAEKSAQILIEQKRKFDTQIWQQKK